MTRMIPSACAALMLLAGCGGATETTEEETTTTSTDTSGAEETATTASAEEVPSPPEPWEGMSPEAKGQWMSEQVLPRMRERFQAFDGERYATVSCATCHGPGAAAGEFEMPSTSLPALPPTGSPEQQAMVRQYGPMARFMFQQVLPTMQTLVGGEEFDEETGEGFSCFACHPHQGDEGSTLIELEMEEAAEGATEGE